MEVLDSVSELNLQFDDFLFKAFKLDNDEAKNRQKTSELKIWDDTQLLQWLKLQLTIADENPLHCVPELKNCEWQKYQITRVTKETCGEAHNPEVIVRKLERICYQIQVLKLH